MWQGGLNLYENVAESKFEKMSLHFGNMSHVDRASSGNMECLWVKRVVNKIVAT